MLIGSFLLGWDAMASLVDDEMARAFTEGYGQRGIIMGYLAAMPLVALLIAALLGMRAATVPQEDIGRTATIATLYGMPILWANVAVGAILAAALIGWTESTDKDVFDRVFQMFRGTFFFMVFATGITAAFAAFVATSFERAFGRAQQSPAPIHPTAAAAPPPAEDIYETPPTAAPPGASPWPTEAPSPPPAYEEPEPAYTEPVAGPPAAEPPADAPYGKELVDFPLDCPRCGHGFVVNGARPLRIQCPKCGKSGTIP